jgi:peroxin-11B
MATIASQVVLHPFVSNGLKFGGTTVGRDKVYPTTSRMMSFQIYLEKLDLPRCTILRSLPRLATSEQRL